MGAKKRDPHAHPSARFVTPVASRRGPLPHHDIGRPRQGSQENPRQARAHTRLRQIQGEPADAGHPGKGKDRGDARTPATASNNGDGDRADKLDGHGGAQRQAGDGLVKRRVHGQHDDAEQRGNRQIRAGQAAAPRALPREEDERARQDAPPRDRRRLDGGESDDRERRTHVLDEARADDVQLGRDAVGDQGALGCGGALAHEAGAKVSAAEFMQ